MPNLVFTGIVFSGESNGKKFIEMPWVKRQIELKLGFSPYLGTLNLRLTGKNADRRILLETAEGMVVEPHAGYYPGLLFRATVDAMECAVVIPIMPNYPNDVLEVVASICLREHLKLVDGSVVTVTVSA